MLAVPADWGEQIRAQVDARLTDEVREAATVGAGLEVSVINPLRRDVTVSLFGPTARRLDLRPVGEPARERRLPDGAMSWPMHPANRVQPDPTRKGASLAGMHYVVVSLKLRGGETNLPYTLTMARENVLGDVAPTYAEVDGTGAADRRLASGRLARHGSRGGLRSEVEPASADQSQESGSIVPWLVGGAAVLVVLARPAGFVARRRRG